jgi:hypothetical protein
MMGTGLPGRPSEIYSRAGDDMPLYLYNYKSCGDFQDW